MDKYVVQNRSDGSGSRLFSLVNTMWLSKKIFGSIDNAKFLWNETRFQDKGDSKADSNNTTMRNFKDTIIIGASCENKEEFFTDDFIAKHYIEAVDSSKSMSIFSPCGKSFKKFKENFLNGEFECVTNEISFMSDVFKDISKELYREETAKCWQEIGFNSKITKMQELAIKHAKELLGGGEANNDFIAIHLRSGDAIYTYAPYRLANRQSTKHATPYEFALGIINENKDKKILIIGDDVTSMRELYKIASNENVILVENLRNIDEYTNLELFIYDITIMSQASKIYGTHSALVKIAHLINPKNEWIHPHTLPKDKLYAWMKEYYDTFKVLSPSQRAFSCFHLFMQGEVCGEDLNVLLKYLNDALSYDSENDKYRIHIINILLKQDKMDEAEKFLEECLNTRFDPFTKLLVSKYWSGRFAFEEVFNNFISHANEKYVYLSYATARICKVANNFKNAIKFYTISQSLSFIDIDETLTKLKDDYIKELENSKELLSKELLNKELLNKELLKLKNKNLILEHKLKGSAKTRIQNQLTYKLGKAIMENSKFLWGYIRLPYVLSYISDSHANELKEREKKSEKLPKIETLYDYKEALKIKNQMSYKIGEAFIRGCKTWYKGGLIKFIFEAQKIKKEYKKK